VIAMAARLPPFSDGCVRSHGDERRARLARQAEVSHDQIELHRFQMAACDCRVAGRHHPSAARRDRGCQKLEAIGVVLAGASSTPTLGGTPQARCRDTLDADAAWCPTSGLPRTRPPSAKSSARTRRSGCRRRCQPTSSAAPHRATRPPPTASGCEPESTSLSISPVQGPFQ
jgi:hypothetical protein